MTSLNDDLFERTIRIVEERVPELTDGYLRVPLSYYRDEQIAARERELFMTQPRPLIGASEIPDPNDYLVRASMGRSVLFTRDEEGVAHAFLNYCRHRGAEPAQGCGNAKRLACPYHGWAYDAKGKLVFTPLASRNASLDYEQLGLVELPSEERHGLIWTILTPGLPIDVAAHLGPVDDHLAQQQLDQRVYYPSLATEIAANWKVAAEGSLEALHVPFVHQSTFNVLPKANGEEVENRYSGFPDFGVYERLGSHVHWILPLFGPEGIEDARRIHAGGEALDWQRLGNLWMISPGVSFANDVYGVATSTFEPGPTAAASFMRSGWMAKPEAPADFPAPEAMAERIATATREDIALWTTCGRGLAVGEHEYSLIGRNEKGLHLFHEALSEQIRYEGLEYV